jgi:hypothetical protein
MRYLHADTQVMYKGVLTRVTHGFEKDTKITNTLNFYGPTTDGKPMWFLIVPNSELTFHKGYWEK